MKIALLVAGIVVLAAAAGWALSSSRPAGPSYTVEESDTAAAPGALVIPEVVVRANQMPEVVVRAWRGIEVASLDGSGSEFID
jgi:hypothetical protein